MEDQPLLDPLNLLFFKEQIFQLGYIEETDLPQMLKTTFELLLCYTFIFFKKESQDYFINRDLLKESKKMISEINKNLGSYVDNEKCLKQLFNSKLISALAKGLNCDSESLQDRQKLSLELILMIVKLQERLNMEFNKNIPLGFE